METYNTGDEALIDVNGHKFFMNMHKYLSDLAYEVSLIEIQSS